ncbi:DUF2917 domain-containing protein [uncultured Sphaerotilus sp.]|uniref:DUF2917 domain-containing protein n=1 Tax=uncultured Sphaerotilus sp. TaxID=474984 RepID=UPI0030CA3BCC
MDTTLHFTPSSPLSLRPGAVLTLARPHDGYTRVQVDAGRIWLTQSGDPGDHFIAAGEDWLLCGEGAVVIECDGVETVRLQVWHTGSVRVKTRRSRSQVLVPNVIEVHGGCALR